MSRHQERGNPGASPEWNSVVLGEDPATTAVLVPVSRQCEKVPVGAMTHEENKEKHVGLHSVLLSLSRNTVAELVFRLAPSHATHIAQAKSEKLTEEIIMTETPLPPIGRDNVPVAGSHSLQHKRTNV